MEFAHTNDPHQKKTVKLGIDRRITRTTLAEKTGGKLKPPGVLGIVATLQLGAQLNSGTVGNTFRTPGERTNQHTYMKIIGFSIMGNM